MKVRIMGTSEEVQKLVELLPAIMKVTNVSGEYPNRGSNDVRVYVDGHVDPQNLQNNEELKKANKVLTDGCIDFAMRLMQNEKYKKAIEIIKEKSFMRIVYSQEEQKWHFVGGNSLTNEEFKLLKDVLDHGTPIKSEDPKND